MGSEVKERQLTGEPCPRNSILSGAIRLRRLVTWNAAMASAAVVFFVLSSACTPAVAVNGVAKPVEIATPTRQDRNPTLILARAQVIEIPVKPTFTLTPTVTVTPEQPVPTSTPRPTLRPVEGLTGKVKVILPKPTLTPELTATPTPVVIPTPLLLEPVPEIISQPISGDLSSENLLAYLNYERIKAGVRPLVQNPALCEYGEERLVRIIQGDFSHQKIREDSVDWQYQQRYLQFLPRNLDGSPNFEAPLQIGENLARNMVDIHQLMEKWRMSTGPEGHYENMVLRYYTDACVVARRNDKGLIYAVQLFGIKQR